MSSDNYVPDEVPNELTCHAEESAKKIGDFVALLEEAAEKIEKHDIVTGERLRKSEETFEKRLNEIQLAIDEMESFMTQSGVSRFRVVAEKLFQEGQQYVSEIQRLTQHFEKIAAASCESLQKAAENSASWIAESVKTLRLDQVRRLTFDHEERIEDASDHAIKKINKMVKWVHWERLGIALVIAVIVSLTTGLFINDETPWDSHRQVVAERDAGRVLLRAWARLSSDEKSHIESAGSTYL